MLAPTYVSLVLALACGAPSPGPASTPSAEPAVAPAPAATASSLPLYEPARAYTAEELHGMPLRELSLRRNTIYARVGQPFTKRWLVQYFDDQPWYTKQDHADLGRLSDVDRQNAEAIGRTEATLTRGELEARLGPLREAKKAGKATPEQLTEIRLLVQALGEDDGAEDGADAASVSAAGVRGGGDRGDRGKAPIGSPGSVRREIRSDQLTDLSHRDLRLLRNTIFAVHGKPFKTDLMKSYFEQKAWYHADPKYSEDLLTDLDKANLEVILAEENRRGDGVPGGGGEEPPFGGA